MKNKYIALLFLAATTLYSSCTSKLEELPDNRMSLRTPSDVSRLLVDAYPGTYMAALTEMYSDNTDELIAPSWTSLQVAYDQMYGWNDIIADGYGDGPKALFDGSYGAVAAANVAIEFIQQQPNQQDYRAQLGEAYLCRAYAMFHLSNVFCLAYTEANAETALGLPYPLAPENTVGVRYERGTLGQLYRNIETDLLRGLELVGNNYSRPKFHFTLDAANAFAARFYLYYKKYDKAIDYATRVLGANPSANLRDWRALAQLVPNDQLQPNAYINSGVKANLLLLAANSGWGYALEGGLRAARYASGEVLSQTEGMQARAPWGTGTNLYINLWSNTASSKVIFRKVPAFLANADAQGNTGIPYSEFAAFTTDETLLVRAEAYALSGQYERALADINTELSVFSRNGIQLTLDGIRNFYSGIAYYTPTNPTPKKQFHVDFTLDRTTQEPLLQCILQLRRTITMHEGLRLQDVKRYGITIYRRRILQNRTIEAVTDSINVNDPRAAIQLPQETIVAGLQANPRNAN